MKSDSTNNMIEYKKIKKPFWTIFTDPIILLFVIIALAALLSYIVPAGEYNYKVVGSNKVIDPNSFHIIKSTPTSFLGLFSAIPLGLQAAAPLVFMIFLIGGSIKMFESTGAIGGAVAELTRKFGSERSSWVLVLITTFFMFLGAFPGMLEAAIPFAPLVVGIAISMGYDVMIGIAVAVLGIAMGWAAGPTNPYTTGIAQQMAGLPMFSGFGLRFGLWIFLVFLVNGWILRYAKKVKADPTKSVVYGIDNKKFDVINLDDMVFGTRQKISLLVFFITVISVVYGAMYWKWGMTEMSAAYIIGSIIAGIIAGFDASKISSTLMDGAKSIFIGAMAVGLARGISVVLQNAKILDTIVYYLAMPLSHVSPLISAFLMFIIQSLLTFLIPSGSGLAMTTMPIMLPLADIIHLNKQIAILAFQFGDGFAHLAFPTVAVVISYLAYTKVTFDKWLKFVWSFIVLVYITAFATLWVAFAINYH